MLLVIPVAAAVDRRRARHFVNLAALRCRRPWLSVGHGGDQRRRLLLAMGLFAGVRAGAPARSSEMQAVRRHAASSAASPPSPPSRSISRLCGSGGIGPRRRCGYACAERRRLAGAVFLGLWLRKPSADAIAAGLSGRPNDGRRRADHGRGRRGGHAARPLVQAHYPGLGFGHLQKLLRSGQVARRWRPREGRHRGSSPGQLDARAADAMSTKGGQRSR